MGSIWGETTTYHGVSQEYAWEVRVLSLHLLHMADYVLHIRVHILNMYSLSLTATVTNCAGDRRSREEIQNTPVIIIFIIIAH